MQNNLISQAGQMETRGTPNDLLPAMNQVGCIVFGPLIQEVLYPLLHRLRIYPTPRTRITIGFTFISLSMMYATIVQALIYKSPPCRTQPGICGPNQINVWIQAPVYLLMSVGEIFAYVTALEYANENSPKTLEVVVQAVGLLMGGIGSAIAMALTLVAHDPNLIAFYGSLTGTMAITTILFRLLFRDRTKQPVTVDITTSQEDVVLGSMNYARVFQTIDRLPETAPYLDPIDAGGPIVLSCLSLPEFCSHNKDASGAPTLPRQSLRRPLYKYAPRKEHASAGVQQ
jgi:POT family proton-dependent oligopeptide transporter